MQLFSPHESADHANGLNSLTPSASLCNANGINNYNNGEGNSVYRWKETVDDANDFVGQITSTLTRYFVAAVVAEQYNVEFTLRPGSCEE
jgi:hypothetical protein